MALASAGAPSLRAVIIEAAQAAAQYRDTLRITAISLHSTWPGPQKMAETEVAKRRRLLEGLKTSAVEGGIEAHTVMRKLVVKLMARLESPAIQGDIEEVKKIFKVVSMLENGRAGYAGWISDVFAEGADGAGARPQLALGGGEEVAATPASSSRKRMAREPRQSRRERGPRRRSWPRRRRG